MREYPFELYTRKLCHFKKITRIFLCRARQPYPCHARIDRTVEPYLSPSSSLRKLPSVGKLCTRLYNVQLYELISIFGVCPAKDEYLALYAHFSESVRFGQICNSEPADPKLIFEKGHHSLIKMSVAARLYNAQHLYRGGQPLSETVKIFFDAVKIYLGIASFRKFHTYSSFVIYLLCLGKINRNK